MKLGRGFLVEALQGSVMALVQAPRAVHGQPHLAHAVQGQMAGHDRAGEKRGVSHVEIQPGFGHGDAGLGGFGQALVGQGHIVPAGEEVLLIPRALAVAEDDEGAGHATNLV
jgi:hypothetical protein